MDERRVLFARSPARLKNSMISAGDFFADSYADPSLPVRPGATPHRLQSIRSGLVLFVQALVPLRRQSRTIEPQCTAAGATLPVTGSTTAQTPDQSSRPAPKCRCQSGVFSRGQLTSGVLKTDVLGSTPRPQQPARIRPREALRPPGVEILSRLFGFLVQNGT